ncbi:hypothetical protein D3C72_1491060 [compost metagenome]
MIALVIALGVVVHLCRRHLNKRVLQAQLREQLLLHQLHERGVQAFCCQVTEQAQARVGVQPVRAGGIVGFPVAVVVEQRGLVLDLFGELQWQAASAVGPQVEQGDAIEGAALQLRPVLAGRIAERQLAAGLGVGCEGGGEGLAHRTDLEQRLGTDGLAAVF